MRGHDIPPTAAKRIRNDHRTTATDEFEHQLLADGVYDDIVEDEQLARVEAAIATAEQVSDLRVDGLEGVDYCGDIDRAVGRLREMVRPRIMEVCAKRCRAVLVDGDNYVEEGWREAEAVAAAKREAANWLLEHREVCRRLWGEEAEAGVVVDSMEVDADA